MLIRSEWLSHAPDAFPTREHSGCAQLSYYTASYREWGEGPPLLLLPGLAGGIELIAPLARQLARYFRVVALQLRGEEDCFALRRRFGISDLVGDISEFMEWYGLERPDMMGVSFGGVLALEFAARHPHRLRSLGVQGVGARFERGLVKSVAAHALTGFPLPRDNPFINQFVQLLFGRGPQPRFLVDHIARLCWQTDQSVMNHRFRLVRHMDLIPRLNAVRAPVISFAARRDVLVSDQSLLDLCNRLEEVKLVRLDAGGHLAFVLHPERIADDMHAFAMESAAA